MITNPTSTQLSNFQLRLTWDNNINKPAPIQEYEIYVNGTLNGSTVHMTYDTVGLNGGQTYDITIVSVDIHGIKSNDVSIQGTTSNIGRHRPRV